MNIHFFKDAINTITNQPLTRDKKLITITRFFMWRMISRFKPDGLIYHWVGDAKFYFKRKEWGIVSNVYTGLLEFEEMSFLLHTLRNDDLFIDIGANHGSFSILASAVIGAQTIAFEPIPTTFDRLVDNVMLNQISEQVSCNNKALGAAEGKVSFTLGEISSLSHIVLPSEDSNGAVEVDITTLDNELSGCNPTMLKIDVEGYEMPVLEGARKTLEKESLIAVIIELNEFGEKYGYADRAIIDKLISSGFDPYAYDPFRRDLKKLIGKNPDSRNTIFIRDISMVEDRITNSPTFSVLGKNL